MQNEKETRKLDKPSKSPFFVAIPVEGAIKGKHSRKEDRELSVWDKAQQICDETGKQCSIYDLMEIPCQHKLVLPNGGVLTAFYNVPQHYIMESDKNGKNAVNFAVRVKVCAFCGKAVRIDAQKA